MEPVLSTLSSQIPAQQMVPVPFPGSPSHRHQHLKQRRALTCVGSTSPWMMLRMAM